MGQDQHSFSLFSHYGMLGFPVGSDGKESAWNAGDLGLIPGLGRFPGEGNGYLTLCNPMNCSMPGVPVLYLTELAQITVLISLKLFLYFLNLYKITKS